MKRFQVITDSTSDLVLEDREKYGIDYVKMVFTIDGVNYDADLDWTKISPSSYYNLMRAGKRSVTGLVRTSEFEEKFEKYINMGLDILYISCSSKLSGSINNANMVCDSLKIKYPNARIICVDSLRSCYAEAMISIYAANLANSGLSIDEAVIKIEDEKLKYQTYATVGSLEWLKKAGRVKASQAFFGNLFGVKPIILGDAIGNNYAFKKVKGRKTSLDELCSIVSQRITNSSEQIVYIEHADCIEDANYVKNIISTIVNPKDIIITSVGPIIGATVGPDTIIVNFYGEKVTIVGDN